MTLPTIVPAGFAGDYTDFLKVKLQRDGSAFVNAGVVSIPSGTVVTTIVGLVPFTANAKISVTGLSLFAAALGASVTASIGVVYQSASEGTDVPTLFVSGSTTVAAGGAIAFTPTATNVPYVTTGNGWIAVTLAGATTGSTGSINVQALISYFSGGIQ